MINIQVNNTVHILFPRYLSRVTLYGSVLDIAVSYQCSDSISDPTVFERDLSVCQEVKIGSRKGKEPKLERENWQSYRAVNL